MKILKYILVGLFLTVTYVSYSQEGETVKPLFTSDSLLELQLSMDVRTVINNRTIGERKEHKAKLSYLQSADDTVTLKVKVSVRGNNRANPKVCNFPPLKLNFKKKKVDSTLFAGQNKLKLVTHCNSGASNEEFILREYYVYKLYEILSPYSFKVRLARISYADSNKKFKPDSHYGFLIENIKELAKRNGMVEFNDSIRNQEMCQRQELDRLMFFQYLIGNLDWSIPFRHNFKLIAQEGSSRPIAVPYDFDYAGIINNPNAEPPINMDIESVRTRVFRGLCRVTGGYDDAVAYFQDKKPEIYALYQNAKYLSEKSKKYTIRYLDSFYKVLDNPKLFEQKIFKACWANHKHLYQY